MARMKKIELIQVLSDMDVKFDHKDNYEDLYTLYLYSKDVELEQEMDERMNELTVEDEITKELTVEDEIIIIMEQLNGKINGTHSQIKEMFRLYNGYFKRWENPTCSACVSRVYKQMLTLYKKLKE